MLNKLRKFRALSATERALFLHALAVLPLTALALRCLRLGTVIAVLQRASRRHVANPPPVDAGRRAEEVEQVLQRAARHGLARGTCLSRSIVLWWLLRRSGIDAELRIGVAKDGRELAAHAWVEQGGRVLNDRPDVSARYAPFAKPIGPS